jgi:hypothetical protein
VELAGRPFALAAIAVVLGIAGAAYQIGNPSSGANAREERSERP